MQQFLSSMLLGPRGGNNNTLKVLCLGMVRISPLHLTFPRWFFRQERL
jgi:hypothetical protein